MLRGANKITSRFWMLFMNHHTSASTYTTKVESCMRILDRTTEEEVEILGLKLRI